MDWVKLFDWDGREINLNHMQIRGLKLDIPSPAYEREAVSVDGKPGQEVIDRRLLPRELTMHCWIQAENYRDSLRARDKLHEVVGAGETLYVMETNNPGKWWKVTAGEWEITRINGRIFSFELPLTAHAGVAESVRLHKETYTDTEFIFYNQGNRPIDLRWQDETEILFTGVSNGLTIENRTTGDLWTYNGSTGASDTLLLAGVWALKNGASVFRDTNKKMLTFAPGRNEIEIRGAGEGFELSIRTRFYYL